MLTVVSPTRVHLDRGHRLIVPVAPSRSAHDLPGPRWSRTSVHRPLSRKTCAADSPWTSACSAPTQPPGRSSRAAVDSSTRMASSPSSPDHSARAGSWSRASGRDARPGLERDVRRVADHHVDAAVELREGVGHVAEPQVDTGRRRGCARPRRGRTGPARRRAPARRAPRRRRSARSRRSRCTGRPRRRRVPPLPGPLDRPPGEQLGLRPGHEDPRSHLQLDVAERGRTGQVLQRLAGGPPGDQLLEALTWLLGIDRVHQRAAGCGWCRARGRAARLRRTPGWRRRPRRAGRAASRSRSRGLGKLGSPVTRSASRAGRSCRPRRTRRSRPRGRRRAPGRGRRTCSRCGGRRSGSPA